MTSSIRSSQALHVALENVIRLMDAADYLLVGGHHAATLVLAYSALDQVSWLGMLPEHDQPGKVGERFIWWVNKYMLPDERLPGFTGADIYGARCGVIHTGSAESDQSRKKRARLVWYADGNESAEDLRRAVEISGWEHPVVTCHIEDLLVAIRNGMAKFSTDLGAHAHLARRTMKRAEGMLRRDTNLIRAVLSHWDREHPQSRHGIL